MFEKLHEWQELTSGILALIAGAFIFIQGSLDRRSQERARAAELAQSKAKTQQILYRLDQAASDLLDHVERHMEIIDDVLSAVENGDENVQLPAKIVIPKVFDTIFAQLTTQDVSIDAYLRLSMLLERGVELDEDFRRFSILFGQSVTEFRPGQPRLPLGGVPSRRSSDDPAQTLLISCRALREAVVSVKECLSDAISGGECDGRELRSGQRLVDTVQPVEGRARLR